MSTKPMLRITWSRGPDLPQGFQDSGGGIVHDTLVTTCGFCNGDSSKAEPDRKWKYPRGFLKKTWGLDLGSRDLESRDLESHDLGSRDLGSRDLGSPGARSPDKGWTELPHFPGIARQGILTAVARDMLHAWGGFNYTSPYCYADGYRLSRFKDGWEWTPLPPLPWTAGGGSGCVVGSRIYLFGGADYDEKRFYTLADRTGGTPRLGARLLEMDADNPAAGFRELPECPGTPRWVAGLAAAGGRIFLIGGATGDMPGMGYCTVVDNWVFDPAGGRWSRIRDLPISSGNFPSGAIVFQDRYIILVGGYQYAKVANPDGTVRDPYGKASRWNGEGAYHNDVFVYDTRRDLFGVADSLPLNNNLPMAVVRGSDIYLIGGETGGAVVEGVRYGQHPDLLLRGMISTLS